MRGQSSLLNKSPNIRLQSFLQIIQKALDMNWESIYKNDAVVVSNIDEVEVTFLNLAANNRNVGSVVISMTNAKVGSSLIAACHLDFTLVVMCQL
jgi:hypothetical protein